MNKQRHAGVHAIIKSVRNAERNGGRAISMAMLVKIAEAAWDAGHYAADQETAALRSALRHEPMGEPHSPKRTVGMIEVDETHVRAFRTTEVSEDFEPHEAIAAELRCDRDGVDGMVALQVARMAREHFSHLAHIRMWGDTRAEVIA